MNSGYYAHSSPDAPRPDWHALSEHLQAVAELAAQFGERFEGADWARAAGLWHDLGKYSCAFQDYLTTAGGGDHHLSEQRGLVDHSTAGAQHAVRRFPILGHLLAYAISGHHGGLSDAISEGACLEKRLRKPVEKWEHGLEEIRRLEEPRLPSFLQGLLSTEGSGSSRTAFAFSFFTRMIFSCLVDADFLDTERFMSPRRAAERPAWPTDILERIACLIDEHVANLEVGSGAVDAQRRQVREACLRAANQAPGLFSLTVPTGGGKTLSSLSFALRHASVHGFERVIYVAPFTSIIEQNADVFRRVTKPLVDDGLCDPVLEHHSAVDVGLETAASRLATENWDAPIIVTTSVQFYESLFSNRPRGCRKLHRIAGSVVVLDEAQALPVDFLEPCLDALRELGSNYNSSVVLCTATQPAVHARDEFEIGLEGVREIIPDPYELQRALARVVVGNLGPQTDAEVVEHLRRVDNALCIVNTRRHARELFEHLRDGEGVYHLSASMCPAHRTAVLREIVGMLDLGRPCRLVSTQVIEAGVDVDFKTVYRSMAGLDSIAQAAGRCNRNGRLQLGEVFVFESEHREAERFLRDTSNQCRQIIGTASRPPLYDDLLSIEAIEHYFRLYFWSQNERWDAKGIKGCFRLDPSGHDLPFLFQFAEASRNFRIIESAGQSIYVPWGDEGSRLCEDLRSQDEVPPMALLRRLQRFTVQIRDREYESNVGRSIELIQDRYPVLVNCKAHYDEQLGLVLGAPTSDAFVI